MLILTRKPGQTLCLYPEDKLGKKDSLIEINFLEITGCQLKIGINAPNNVKVFRKEIHDKILDEQLYELMGR